MMCFAIMPILPKARICMGMLRRLQGRLTDARIELEIIIGLRPNNTLTLGQLGITLAFLGQPAEAIPLIERSLDWLPLGGINSATYADLGLCRLLLGQIKEATNCLRKALLLAVALGPHGDLDEAGEALRQAIATQQKTDTLSKWRALPWYVNLQLVAMFDRTVGVGLQRAGLADY